MRHRVNIFVPMLILVLVGCTNSNGVQIAPPTHDLDGSALRDPFIGDPCAAPCWYNIVPGETTKDEALGLLNEQQLPCRYVDINESSQRGIRCNSIWMPFEEANTIKMIVFYSPGDSITIGEVVEHFGEPNFVVFDSAGGTVEQPSVIIDLLYTDKGLSFEVVTEEDSSLMLNEAFQLEAYTYRQPEDILSLVERLKSDKNAFIFEWHGFADYQGYQN
jgi:hypothetical protein